MNRCVQLSPISRAPELQGASGATYRCGSTKVAVQVLSDNSQAIS